mgnify:CR=1 FL=1
MDKYGRDEYHVSEIEKMWKVSNTSNRYEVCFEQEVLNCMNETSFTYNKSHQMVVDAYIDEGTIGITFRYNKDEVLK